MEFLTPLLKEDRDYVDPEPYEFEEEQQCVARLVHLVYHHNPDTSYEMLSAFKKQFNEGGIKRMKYTIPSLVFAYFRLARHIKKCIEWHNNPVEEENVDDMETLEQKKFYNVKYSYANQSFKIQNKIIFDEVRQAIDKIQTNFPELSLKLYLELLESINEIDTEKEVILSFIYHINFLNSVR